MLSARESVAGPSDGNVSWPSPTWPAANYIEQEKAPAPFIQLPGVKPLTEFLQLNNFQVPDWEESVRKKVKGMPELLRA